MTTWTMEGSATSYDEDANGIIAHLLSGYFTTFSTSVVTVNGKSQDGLAGWHADLFPVTSFSQFTETGGAVDIIGSIDHINVYNDQNVLIATISDIPAGVNYGNLDLLNPDSSAFLTEVDGTDFNDTIHVNGQFVDGGAGNDTLTGSDGSDGLFGDTGIDSMSGGGGDDLIAINIGDTADGGSGNDLFYFIGAAGAATIDGGTGDDVLDFSTYGSSGANVTMSLSGGVGDITAVNVEAVIGSYFDDNITGSSNNDVIAGLDGNDHISAGAGDDLLDGGLGNDVIDGGTGFDELDYSAATNGVTVDLSAGSATGFGSDTLSGIEKIDGSNQSDILYGDDNANTLVGLSGNDVMDGRGGSDSMIGGDGGDTYYVDSSDSVSELGTDGAFDTEYVSFSAVVADGIESAYLNAAGDLWLTAEAGTIAVQLHGNDGNNVLTGNDGDNHMNGGLGADAMAGGNGSDVYLVDNIGDTVTDTGGDYDQVYASVDVVVSDGIELLSLSGSDNLSATVTGADNTTIDGNDGANVLTGGAGNNWLDGGAGADTMIGGDGSDIYVVDNAGDIIIEASDAPGADMVQTAMSYTLGANIENLEIIGAAAVTATGNELNNLIEGAFGNDLIDGMGGADTMEGGGGDDTYIVDNVADSVIEMDFAGKDTVKASVDFVLTDNVEDLTLTGTADVAATGNSVNNVLRGNSGANRLDGAAGADTMIGGAGNDTYYVDNGGDKISELHGGGSDTVVSSRAYSLGDELEKLTLTGTGNIAGTGNSLNNTLIGNDGANKLSGGAGTDTLSGGLGNDTLDGGKGADVMKGGQGDDRYYIDNKLDTVTEFSGQGSDTVLINGTYTLGLNVENLLLTGAGDRFATGNALDNHITGNRGNNTLGGADGNDIIDGGKGADAMRGGNGDDIFYVDNTGDTVTEYSGQGTDSVISSVSFTLGNNIETLTLTGTNNVSGTGNSRDNILTGNGFNNILDGGRGHDTLTGGLGADTFVFSLNSGADTVTDFSSDDNDHIDLSAYNAQSIAVLTQVDADVQIDLGGGNIVTVLNATATDTAFLSTIIW